MAAPSPPYDSSAGHQPSLRASRWRRANPWLGKLIPSLLLVFAVKGYTLVARDVFPLIYRRRPLAGLVYFAWVNLTLAMTGWSYSTVYFTSRAPPKEKEPPLPVFACDESGAPLRCYYDQCDGAWQSIRTRHCRDCGSCRAGFDHHCAFMDNCISASTYKPFFCFLLYAFLLLVVALVPLAPLQYRAVREVVQQTWGTSFMRELWWSPWYGWAGGPVWRYAGAAFLGYKHYSRLAPDRPLLIPDVETRTFRSGAATSAYDVPVYPSLALPRLSTLAIVVFAVLISSIALAMLVAVVRNTRTGVSTVQLERTRRWRLQSGQANPGYDARLRLWVPLSDSEEGGAVVLVEPNLPLFDFGAGENWRKLMGKEWWEWLTPWRLGSSSDLELNPAVLAALEEKARKQQ
ncbi:Palmitoyltransferase swf1 [Rhodosporidiobolus nylandii]